MRLRCDAMLLVMLLFDAAHIKCRIIRLHIFCRRCRGWPEEKLYPEITVTAANDATLKLHDIVL